MEHDRIEKETEVFDSGELKKLKKFTKGESATPIRVLLTEYPFPSRCSTKPVPGGHGPHRDNPHNDICPRQIASSSTRQVGQPRLAGYQVDLGGTAHCCVDRPS